MFCPQCGKLIPDHSSTCPACNATLFRPDPVASAIAPSEGHSWVVTLLLALFIPLFGVHRFYTGNVVIGVLQLVTAGGCGIWWLIDVILILTGGYRDVDGYPLVK
ncbi:MAG: TM2 domain-containing protein [Planctomycetes bacterium]|nr:TM2 domain-containing protein [Planctomycetota bacterium]